jgi:hypothetical protein
MLGVMPFDKSKGFASTTEAPPVSIGEVFCNYDGDWFRCVKFVDGAGNVAGLLGGVVYYTTLPNSSTPTVTSDQSDGLGLNSAAGILVGVVPADTAICIIQVAGVALVKVAASTAEGDALIGSSTDQVLGRVAEGTAPTHRQYGWAHEAIDATEVGKATATINFWFS